MPSPLTEKEVNRLFQMLDDNQLIFLQSYLKQSKKGKWLEKLAHRPYKCECGITLRYCYIVHHRKENKASQLGETCLGNLSLVQKNGMI